MSGACSRGSELIGHAVEDGASGLAIRGSSVILGKYSMTKFKKNPKLSTMTTVSV